MNVLIMSDIHGNITALSAVLKEVSSTCIIDQCILLGDIIDYGLHSNEVIKMVREIPYPICCNIRGNHEDAILNNNYDRFSSERGKDSAKYTKSILTPDTQQYLSAEMYYSGYYEFNLWGKKCLAVHGSKNDIYWKSISANDSLDSYENFDYVFSGHSHIPHYMEKFYETDNALMRNKKKTIFINPGSVGQPRNHNPMAQYAILDFQNEKITFDKVAYDIKAEIASYTGQTDKFYMTRLEVGI